MQIRHGIHTLKITIENVQRRTTKLIPGICEYSYSKRLQILKLPTLEYRRKRGRRIEVLKTLNGLYYTSNQRKRQRKNLFKIVTKKTRTTARQNFFLVAAINVWNSLRKTVISSESVHVFNSRLDKLWASENYDASFME